MSIGDALIKLADDSKSLGKRHQEALKWQYETGLCLNVIWLPKGWAWQHSCSRRLISDRAFRRINAARRSEHSGLRLRAQHIMDERAAIQLGIRGLLDDSGRFPASDLFVRYTRLGQPKPGWRGEAAALGQQKRIRLRDLHISFSHDGEAVLAIAAHAAGLRGVGIDVVQLDRLRGKGRDYLNRFARHFMSEEEYDHFEAESAGESEEAVLRRAAAHFSLMESASKALGTGLKIGGGMGKPESLPKQSIGVRLSRGETEFVLDQEAEDRLRFLRASRLEGYYSSDSEYLVSAAFLTS